MRWNLCILSAFAIGLSGCAVFGGRVSDLAFVSVEPFPLHGKLSNLRLRFSSNEDLRAVSERYETDGAYATVSLCPFHADPSIGVGRVLHNGIDIGARPAGDVNDASDMGAQVAAEDNAHGPFIYEADFSYYEQWRVIRMTNGGSYSNQFPLPSTPQDLCVQVYGPSMFRGVQSNVFVVPKEELEYALETARAQPLGPATWKSDPGQLKCETRDDKQGQRVVLSLGPYHGETLTVHRLADGAWFALIAFDEPMGMRAVMPILDYFKASRLELPPDVMGYRWSPAEGGRQKIFTHAGDYVFYSSTDAFEGHSPDFGCRISIVEPLTTDR